MFSILLLFAALVGWGTFPLVRRASKSVNGQIASMYSFATEFVLIVLVTAIAASYSSSINDSDFNIVPVLTNKNAMHWWALFCGGCIVGFGDAISITALANVPASIGFPTWVGICTASGTTIGYIIDGSPAPSLLFGGVAAFVVSVTVQAATCDSVKETVQATLKKKCVLDVLDDVLDHVIVEADMFDNVVDVEAATATAITTTTTTNNNTTTTTTLTTLSDRQWVLVCMAGGLWNSLWSPAATYGRRPFDNTREVCTLFLLGRVSIQPFCHLVLYLSGKAPSSHPFQAAWQLSIKEKMYSMLCGLLVAGSFFLYFEGSKNVNKTAAFAIGNCCPVFTVVVGVFLGDLQNSSVREKWGVFASTCLFAFALIMLTLASKEPEQ